MSPDAKYLRSYSCVRRRFVWLFDSRKNVFFLFQFYRRLVIGRVVRSYWLLVHRTPCRSSCISFVRDSRRVGGEALINLFRTTYGTFLRCAYAARRQWTGWGRNTSGKMRSEIGGGGCEWHWVIPPTRLALIHFSSSRCRIRLCVRAYVYTTLVYFYNAK